MGRLLFLCGGGLLNCFSRRGTLCNSPSGLREDLPCLGLERRSSVVSFFVWETKLGSEEQTEGQLWCALTLDIFLLLGGEALRETLSTLAVRRCGQKNSTQQ